MTEQKPLSEQAQSNAFAELVAIHAPRVARYIRFRISNASDAEDVLQNTLIAAWQGFQRVHDSERLPTWLLSVAQNRCRDYFRERQRGEAPLAEEMLEVYANRFGLRQHRLTSLADDARDALEAVSPMMRDAARQFYLEGFSIVEIAAAAAKPVGTIKRQLFQARLAARTYLGIPAHSNDTRYKLKREKTMTTNMSTESDRADDCLSSFPPVRPEIQITTLDDTPFPLDCRELRSWPIIPLRGESASFAEYSLPGWRLQEVTILNVIGGARIHDVEGVEVSARSWRSGDGWQRPGAIYARLTETAVEFLAVSLPQKESTQVETFLDESFAWDWGVLTRKTTDRPRIHRLTDGTLRQLDPDGAERGTAILVDVVRLDIGERSIQCTRIVEAGSENDLSKCRNFLTESYLTSDGRSVLTRRYCHPEFARTAQIPVLLDKTQTLTIDGAVFFHWYDTITNLGL